VKLEAGETLISYSTGGGGFGSPTERDPQRVRHDAAEGWISRERAEAVYGVVLDEAGEVDEDATGRRRQAAEESVAATGSSSERGGEPDKG
jgi:N-methylhydantoinase B